MKYVIGIILLVLIGGVTYSQLHDDHDLHDEHGHEELVAKVPVRADGEFTLTTSFYPLQFALEQIVGDLGVVTNIGEGVDPHDFAPTTQDILALQRADLVVLQGAEFEPWGDDVMEQLKADNVPVVVATADLALHEAGGHHDEHEEDHHDDKDEHEGKTNEHDHDEDEHHDEHKDKDHHDEHDHGAYDPHTWLDPVLFSEMVEHLAEAVSTIDPENATTYEANATALQSELATLDTQYQDTLASCTLDEVITSHEAFGYVAERYGFEVHSITGLSTQDSPSVATLAKLKEEAEEGIGVILLEENSITAYGETLARETGLQTLSINPIAYIVPSGENYLTLMQKNLDTFAAALNCNG